MRTSLCALGFAVTAVLGCRVQDPNQYPGGPGGSGVSSISIPEPASFGKVGDKEAKDLRLWVAKSPAALRGAFKEKKRVDCTKDDKGRILAGGQEFCTIRWSRDGVVQRDAKFVSGATVAFALRIYEDKEASLVLAETDVETKDDKASATDCGYAEETVSNGLKISLPVCSREGSVTTGTSSVSGGDGASVEVVPQIVGNGQTGTNTTGTNTTGTNTTGTNATGNTPKACTALAGKSGFIKINAADLALESVKHCVFSGAAKVLVSAISDTSDPEVKKVVVTGTEGVTDCKAGLTVAELNGKELFLSGQYECK